MSGEAGGNADDLVSSQLSLSSLLPLSARATLLESLSRMNTLLMSPFTAVKFFLITLVLHI